MHFSPEAPNCKGVSFLLLHIVEQQLSQTDHGVCSRLYMLSFSLLLFFWPLITSKLYSGGFLIYPTHSWVCNLFAIYFQYKTICQSDCMQVLQSLFTRQEGDCAAVCIYYQHRAKVRIYFTPSFVTNFKKKIEKRKFQEEIVKLKYAYCFTKFCTMQLTANRTNYYANKVKL